MALTMTTNMPREHLYVACFAVNIYIICIGFQFYTTYFHIRNQLVNFYTKVFYKYILCTKQCLLG